MTLPLWVEDQQYPTYLRRAAQEAGEEVLSMENVPEEVRQSAADVRTVLILWSWCYYNGEPRVSDGVYDAGFTYLKTKEAKYPKLKTALSPTQRIGKVMED